jgi:hypothetical protein
MRLSVCITEHDPLPSVQPLEVQCILWTLYTRQGQAFAAPIYHVGTGSDLAEYVTLIRPLIFWINPVDLHLSIDTFLEHTTDCSVLAAGICG